MRRRLDFVRALEQGLRGHDGPLTMWLHPNELDWPRLGLIVGRKFGGAVARNRIKRVMREAFRLSQHELPAGYDLLCQPRRGTDLRLTVCQDVLVRLAARLVRHGKARR